MPSFAQLLKSRNGAFAALRAIRGYVASNPEPTLPQDIEWPSPSYDDTLTDPIWGTLPVPQDPWAWNAQTQQLTYVRVR